MSYSRRSRHSGDEFGTKPGVRVEVMIDSGGGPVIFEDQRPRYEDGPPTTRDMEVYRDGSRTSRRRDDIPAYERTRTYMQPTPRTHTQRVQYPDEYPAQRVQRYPELEYPSERTVYVEPPVPYRQPAGKQPEPRLYTAADLLQPPPAEVLQQQQQQQLQQQQRRYYRPKSATRVLEYPIIGADPKPKYHTTYNSTYNRSYGHRSNFVFDAPDSQPVTGPGARRAYPSVEQERQHRNIAEQYYEAQHA